MKAEEFPRASVVGGAPISQYLSTWLSLGTLQKERRGAFRRPLEAIYSMRTMGAAVDRRLVVRRFETGRDLFTQFEERLNEEVTHPIFGYKVKYRRCIELQVRLVAKFLTGEIEVYPPFLVR